MKLLVVITCFYLICGFHVNAEDKKVNYTGTQLWKIQNENITETILKKLQDDDYLAIWGKTKTNFDALIKPEHVTTVVDKLEESKLQYSVSIKDIQTLIDAENLPPDEKELQNRQGHPLNWKRYHKLQDIYQFLEYIDLTFPKLCSLKTIGYSVEGRPIKLLKISNGNKNNKAIFIEGGIHAREWITPASVTYIINNFVYNFNNELSYIKDVDWYIVPVLNPDGYEYSQRIDRLWRKNRSKQPGNCFGVDLNRNFGHLWDAPDGHSKDPCNRSYRGAKQFSEPEARTIAEFFQNNQKINWKGYIAVHSYGQFLVYPWAAQDIPVVDSKDLEKVAIEAASEIIRAGGVPYTVGPTGITIYHASGSSTDWARGVAGIKYVYTMELRDTGRYGFLLPPEHIEVTSKDALVAVRTIAKTAAAT